MPPHDDADDPPELRRLLEGGPEVVAARAMRMAFEVSKDQELIRGEVRAVGRRIDGVDASIQTLEKKMETTEKAAVVAARHAVLAAATVKTVDERIDTMQGEVMRALGTIGKRLGIVESMKKTPSPLPALIVPTPSQRPISYSDLEGELERLMPKIDAKASDKRWLGIRDGIKKTFSEGFARGGTIIVASLVAALGLMIAGYAVHDCAKVIVKQGTSHEIPKIPQVSE